MAVQAQLYQENLGFPLCGSQDWISDINGCGSGSLNQFCFNSLPKNHNLYHQQQQQQQQQVLLQELQSLNQRNDSVWFSTNTVPTAMFDHVEKKQRQEIDQYIKSQNERLRLILQEQRKQEIVTLMRKAEPKLLAILRDKECEVSEARKRTMELEDLLRKLEEENRTWQRLARESEATVVSLSSALEQAARESAASRRTGCAEDAEDAESCCGGEGGGESGGENKHFCRNCGWRKASVLFLPCRHFCSCKHCEGFLDSCPVCAQPKKACIEASTF